MFDFTEDDTPVKRSPPAKPAASSSSSAPRPPPVSRQLTLSQSYSSAAQSRPSLPSTSSSSSAPRIPSLFGGRPASSSSSSASAASSPAPRTAASKAPAPRSRSTGPTPSPAKAADASNADEEDRPLSSRPRPAPRPSAKLEEKAPATFSPAAPAKPRTAPAASSPLPSSSAPAPRGQKRKSTAPVAASSDPAVVLRHVTEAVERMRRADAGVIRPTLASLHLPGVKREVLTMEEESVLLQVEKLIVHVTASILSDDGFAYDVPVRHSNNQLFVPELNRIVLKDRVSRREFAAFKHSKKAAITTRILQLVYELCVKRIHVTKRDLFYTDVKLFTKQDETDDVLDDVAAMIGATRTSLNVVASEKGIVVGQVSFYDSGDFIDCTKMGVGGKAIPPYIDRITGIQGKAQFVLLVEKDAAFMRLAEDRFYNTYPCIIITAKGQPDVATRLFLKKIKVRHSLSHSVVFCPPRRSSHPPRLPSDVPRVAGDAAHSHPGLGGLRPLRPEDPVRVPVGLQKHVVRLRVADHARHPVAGRSS